jgi:hypothetical protein
MTAQQHHRSGMDNLINLHDDHVFRRAEALDLGYRDADLREWVRGGELTRVRQGSYVQTSIWNQADDVERHRLRAHAVLRSHNVPLALSHTSAAVEHQLRLFRPDLSMVHVACLGEPIARTTHDIVYHRGAYGEDDLTWVGAQQVVVPVLAGLQAASLTNVAAGIVVLDSVVDLEKGSLEDIHRRFDKIANHPFSRTLQITVRLVRKGANSVGESLSRHMMWAQHLPEPVLQFEVRDASGRLIGITDFAWPQFGVLGEFDGMQKYGRLLKAGQTAGDAVQAEKIREDALREATNWLVLRLIWGEIFKPGATAVRIRRQLERGHKLLVA